MNMHYQQLAEAAAEVCGTDFSEARIVAKIGDDSGNIRFDCAAAETITEGLRSDTPRDYRVYKALKKIRESMTIPGQQPWSRCTFTLFPDGKFKFDVEYDD
jgi:hypothetical protein